MGALTAEYRCSVTDIRDATEDDFEAVLELLVARSRAAFGFSAEQPAFLRQRWDGPATDNWVAVESGALVGYASLDEGQDFVHAAVDPAVGDALITVTIAEHPLFKREGANLRLELPVTLYEAVLGGQVHCRPPEFGLS